MIQHLDNVVCSACRLRDWVFVLVDNCLDDKNALDACLVLTLDTILTMNSLLIVDQIGKLNDHWFIKDNLVIRYGACFELLFYRILAHTDTHSIACLYL